MVLLFICCEFSSALFQVVVELEYDSAAGHANRDDQGQNDHQSGVNHSLAVVTSDKEGSRPIGNVAWNQRRKNGQDKDDCRRFVDNTEDLADAGTNDSSHKGCYDDVGRSFEQEIEQPNSHA